MRGKEVSDLKISFEWTLVRISVEHRPLNLRIANCREKSSYQTTILPYFFFLTVEFLTIHVDRITLILDFANAKEMSLQCTEACGVSRHTS